MMNEAYRRGKEAGVKSCAAGPWRTDDPPRDGTVILARFGKMRFPFLVEWGVESDYEDQALIKYGWVCSIDGYFVADDDPIRWAEIHVEEVEDE